MLRASEDIQAVPGNKPNEVSNVSESRYRRLFEETQEGLLILEAGSGKIMSVNPFFTNMFGYSEEEILGKSLWEIGLFRDYEANKIAFGDLKQKGNAAYEDFLLKTFTGRMITVEFACSVYQVEQTTVIQCNFRHRSKKKRNRGDLKIEQHKYLTLFRNINEYFYRIIYFDGQIISVFHSSQCKNITGYSSAEINADSALWFKMVHPEDRERIRDCCWGGLEKRTNFLIQHRIFHKDGSLRWVINNFTTRATKKSGLQLDGAMIDITDLKIEQDKNVYFAYYDSLTKLPNRNLLWDRLEKAVVVARREEKNLAVLFLDVDNFKSINDTFGHANGDRVLIEVGRRLNELIRAGDTVARFGGDEFVILLWNCGIEGASHVADKLVGTAIQVENLGVGLGVSVGISVFPDAGGDAQLLLRNADAAMYQAKQAGGGKYRFFTKEMTAKVQEKANISVDMKRALKLGQFILYYQPKINISTGKVCGVEALIRWRHPIKGIIMPMEFLAIAEEIGLGRQIMEWLIATACRQTRQWQQMVPRLSVSVNMSAACLQNHSFEDQVVEILHQTDFPPSCLELELTENAIMNDSQQIRDKLASMKALGMKVSVDNFGTGYSNLPLLKKLSVDILKIDKTIVRNMSDQSNLDLVRTLIHVGHVMNATVVAEGIENSYQLEFLKQEGCDEGQGYFFSQPLPAEELSAFFVSHRQ